jgi:hypothetical protein
MNSDNHLVIKGIITKTDLRTEGMSPALRRSEGLALM